MKLVIDPTRDEPVYQQICQRLRERIDSGELPAGTRLPATRRLASDLGVNRATVTAAYDALGTLGYVEATVGRGTFVRKRDQDPLSRGGAEPGMEVAAKARVPGFSRGIDNLVSYPTREELAVDHPRAVDFAALFPDESFFPVATFRRLMAEVLAGRGRELLQYGSPDGDPGLKAFIARELRRVDISVDAEDILIVNGAQQGLDLILRVFIDPGDPVVVEAPTYWSMLPALGFYRAEVVEVPMTPQGLDVEILAALLAERRPKLIYTMPNFQNPTGLTMSLEARQRLVQLARQHGIPIVEDDYERDLRLEGDQLPSLKALDPGGTIMHLGTFSKGLFPGLRLGWIAAPQVVLDRLSMAKRYSDLHTSSLLQAVIAAFCNGGHYDRHLKKLQRIYRERRSCTLEALADHFPAEVSWTRPDGGYALWVTLPPEVDVRALLNQARAEGVVFTPGSYFFTREQPFALDQQRNGFRLSIARTDQDAIQRGIEILGRLIRLELGRRTEPRAPRDRSRRGRGAARPHV